MTTDQERQHAIAETGTPRQAKRIERMRRINTFLASDKLAFVLSALSPRLVQLALLPIVQWMQRQAKTALELGSLAPAPWDRYQRRRNRVLPGFVVHLRPTATYQRIAVCQHLYRRTWATPFTDAPIVEPVLPLWTWLGEKWHTPHGYPALQGNRWWKYLHWWKYRVYKDHQRTHDEHMEELERFLQSHDGAGWKVLEANSDAEFESLLADLNKHQEEMQP